MIPYGHKVSLLPFDHFALTAISPTDGRYRSQLPSSIELFSEFSLIQARVEVEIKYLLFLADQRLIPSFSENDQQQLLDFATNFDLPAAEAVKTIELTTKHDVKAVEYYLRQKMQALKIAGDEFLHLALTSEDVNSLAYSILMMSVQKKILVPELKRLLLQLNTFNQTHADIPMLARTHGQAAVPTTVGKEISNFVMRLLPEVQDLENLQIEGKLTGAVGNFNAHLVAFPEVNWIVLSQKFVKSLGLEPQLFTTQIAPVENFSKLFSNLMRINFILLDLTQDCWRYISDGYFIQGKDKGQVGSSTMPQKVNPIDFENSEGNLGLANSLFQHFITKLPISRLQRDLSDSTVKRHFGTAFALCLLSYKSLQKGFNKIRVDNELLTKDLNQHWEVLTEAFQVVLRKSGDSKGYEKLQSLAQGKVITQQTLVSFIKSVDIDEHAKNQLLGLSPITYLGLAPELTKQAVSIINKYLKEDHDTTSS